VTSSHNPDVRPAYVRMLTAAGSGLDEIRARQVLSPEGQHEPESESTTRDATV
jgi:hypothetical protein